MRTEYCGLIGREYLGKDVELCGWVHRRRDHGGVVFIDLRDREGIVQVVCDPDRPQSFGVAETLRNEFVVRVFGRVRPRPEGTVNPNLVSGEVEVLADRVEVLNTAATPPFQLDDEHLSETVRLEHRVVDLRRPVMQRNLRLRYQVAMAVRRYLDRHGFIDIETPMLTRSTPEGARDYLVPSRVHHGHFYALPAVAAALQADSDDCRLRSLRPNRPLFSRRGPAADRQPEFTQVDVEMSFVDARRRDWHHRRTRSSNWRKKCSESRSQVPLPRMTYDEAMRRFGHDAPDLRFGMEIVDCTDLAETIGLWRVQGGRDRSAWLCAGHQPEKRERDLQPTWHRRTHRVSSEGPGSEGARLVQAANPTASSARRSPSSLAKRCSPSSHSRLDAEPGDLILFSAADWASTCKILACPADQGWPGKLKLYDPEGNALFVGGRVPDVRVRPGGAALERDASPLHRAARRARGAARQPTRPPAVPRRTTW
jgi:aspartyl-tRNA synthetase